MATHNKNAAKTSKGSKSKPVVKKAVPAKKTVAPAKKKPVVKPAAKKAATPAKKAPVKAVAPKVAAKTVKKATPNNKTAKNNNQKTVNKKNSKQAAPAKKATPVKKAAPVAKKAAPVAKKAAPSPVKKAAPAKPAAKAPAKPVAKAPVKPAAKPVAKPAAKAPAKPEPKPVAKAPAKPEPKPIKPKSGKGPTGKKLTHTQMPVKINPSAPKPMATPAARPVDKKPTVIIAHRRLENKSKAKESTNTMVQYQPEAYRSILDEPQQIQGPVYRYSDEELNEFREIIASRLDAARKELNYLQGLITRKDEAGTEDTENRYMNMEDGSGAMEREQLAQLASRQIQFMSHLEKALVRIENKTYGICRVTGKLIDKARLRAVPHATLSIEAKKFMSSKHN